MSERFKNQHRLIDQDRLAKTKFIVIGAGAIGSFYVATLAKMGATDVTVYDDDTIEDHNISNQLYPITAVGKAKSNAVEDLALLFGDAPITGIKGRWTPENAQDGDIIVSAVDSMDTRKAIWDHYKTRPNAFFLEGRMGAQVYRVYGVDLSSAAAVDLYEKNLYPSSEATPDRCGEKSIIYTVLQVAGQMLAQTKRFLNNECRPTEVIYDCFRDELMTKHTMEEVVEVIEAPDEPQEALNG